MFYGEKDRKNIYLNEIILVSKSVKRLVFLKLQFLFPASICRSAFICSESWREKEEKKQTAVHENKEVNAAGLEL